MSRVNFTAYLNDFVNWQSSYLRNMHGGWQPLSERSEQSGYYSAHSWNLPLIRREVIYDNNLQSHSREFITLKGIVFLKQ